LFDCRTILTYYHSWLMVFVHGTKADADKISANSEGEK
jgi:hypothetical protein